MARGKQQRWREAAIVALMTKPTVAEAAAAAGISYRTLKRWLADPDFLAEYRAARKLVVETAIGRLQQAMEQAVDALLSNLRSGSPAARNAAAKIILDKAIGGAEVAEIFGRLEKLERAKKKSQQPV
jgi:hypothetical protein